MKFGRVKRKLSASLIYGLRLLFRNSVTRDFLTGDGFARLADVEFFPTNGSPYMLRGSHSLQEAKIIFCPSDKLEDMMSNYGSILEPNVFIFGNSDRDFHSFNFRVPNSVKKIFLQNSFISNDFFCTLPIGLENIRFGRNGIPILFSRFLLMIPKKDKVLVGPFSPTHLERQDLEGLEAPNVTRISKRVSPLRMAYLIARHKYVAAPRGNGVDTHRLWESIYRGSIPIVLENQWSRSLIAQGLPIILISNWSVEALNQGIKSFDFQKFDPKGIGYLWLNFWEQKIASFNF